MPKAGAAKLIARDARKHKEERKVKVKQKGTTHKNRGEFAKRRKKKKTKKTTEIDNDDLFGNNARNRKELTYSLTDELYQQFQNSPNYMLSIQPSLIEELSSESEEEEDEGVKTLTQSVF